MTDAQTMKRANVSNKTLSKTNKRFPSDEIREALSPVLSLREIEDFEAFFWREINLFRLLDGADKSDKSPKEQMACILDLTKRVLKLRTKLSEMPRGVKACLLDAHFARSRTSIHDLLERLDVDLEDIGIALNDSEAMLSECVDTDERGRPEAVRRNRLLSAVAKWLTSAGVRKGKAAELAGECLRVAGVRVTDDPGDLAKLIARAGE